MESEWDGIRVITAPDLLWGRLRSGWDLWSMFNRFLYLRNEKPDYDLIHCFETRPGTIHPALYYSRRHNIPLLSDWNDWFGRGGIIDILRPKWYRVIFGRFETYYEEAFRPLCVGTTTISTALAKRAEGLNIPPERLCYISGGTTPELHMDNSLEECRSRLSLPMDTPLLGFASSDSHLDLDLVFSSLAIVARSIPSVKLVLTGKVHPSILQMAEERDVKENLLQTGFLPREELPWWLGSTNVCLLPFPETVYNVGRWPNKVGLYMSLGRPIVTNPAGDVKTLIDEHQVGLSADITPEDFAAKIVTLLEDKDLAQRLGRNGRKAAETTYNWKTKIQVLEDFYNHILDLENRKN
jgi:glycosyltransferase involved in cell wall biosynthesis